MTSFYLTNVTPENVEKETFFCIKDIKQPGFNSKQRWFEKQYAQGLRLNILKDLNDKMIGFVEFTPVELAWRPVDGQNFMFIHCLYIYAKKNRHQGLGAMMIEAAEKEAKKKGMDGLCVMSSNGSWIANKSIFEKNGFIQVDTKGRFELLSKKWNSKAPNPYLRDWTKQQLNYQGWHICYANQCPWHEKSVEAMLHVAMDAGIELKVTEIETVEDAKNSPSGFGVFNLLHNGKLLEDHYISATRFKNILKKELKS